MTREEYLKKLMQVQRNQKKSTQYLDIAEEQNFVCAICGQENFKMKSCSSGTLVDDHKHSTGEVRGLLCHNCNRALGLLKDEPKVLQKAMNYLVKCND